MSEIMGAVVHGSNGKPFKTSEFEHSSIPATVKKIFNLSAPYLTKRDEWAATFESILQVRTEPRTDCPGLISFFSSFIIEEIMEINQYMLSQF